MFFQRGKKSQSKKTKELEKIYEEHFKAIYRFFYYKILSKDIAEDLTSETFVALAEKIDYEEKIENEKAYLYGIARNIFIKFLQRKYKECAVDFTENSYLLKDDNFYRYTQNFLREIESRPHLEDRVLPFINMIPSKQKRVMRMRLVEKMTLSEICKKLGKNMNYVKTTQKRGLKSLKKAIACYSYINPKNKS